MRRTLRRRLMITCGGRTLTDEGGYIYVTTPTATRRPLKQSNRITLLQHAKTPSWIQQQVGQQRRRVGVSGASLHHHRQTTLGGRRLRGPGILTAALEGQMLDDQVIILEWNASKCSRRITYELFINKCGCSPDRLIHRCIYRGSSSQDCAFTPATASFVGLPFSVKNLSFTCECHL